MTAGVRFKFDLGDKTLFDRIIRRVEIKSDFTPCFNDMAKAFYEFETKVFDSQGFHGDIGGWLPLSSKYAEWKRKFFPGKKILELTGELKDSLTEEGAKGNVTEISPTAMTLGSTLRVGKTGKWNLARLHQEGTKYMPKRPMINFDRQLKSEWTKIMRNFLIPAKA